LVTSSVFRLPPQSADDAALRRSHHILGMIQRAGVVDSIAAEAAARIVDAVRPWRVVLFGSRARGTGRADSDYDFYVEVDADETALRDIDWRIRESLHGHGMSFDVKVMQRGSLERRRDDPGTIEWDVAREGKVLFADAAAPASIAPASVTPPRVRERPPETPESVAEWVTVAQRDIRHAEHLWQTGEDFWPELCWLAQQMCEKLMKALLVSRFVRPERTHDLEKLLDALRRDGLELGALDGECKLLTPYAIAARYGAGLGLTEQNARDARDAAERITSAVRDRLGAERS
jgi:HEPN domain-containing protein/predicted nucleotidyltransferase